MIKLPMTAERYQEILDRLLDPSLKVKLSSNPTVMGPRYVSDKIVEILTAKTVINDLLEEVDKAYAQAQILLNDLNTELELRTHMELNNLVENELKGLNAAAARALVREKVDEGYRVDQRLNLAEGDSDPTPFQLWEDLRVATASEIELKGLVKMLDRRRDELTKKESGVRLQQKTIDVEMKIHKNPLSQKMGNGTDQEFDGVIPHHRVDPDAYDEGEDGILGSENRDPVRIPEESGVE